MIIINNNNVLFLHYWIVANSELHNNKKFISAVAVTNEKLLHWRSVCQISFREDAACKEKVGAVSR
jgi:hypothetical protein